MRSDCYELELTQGFVALIDWADISVASKRWAVSSLASTASTKRYAVRKEGGGLLYLHREIMGAKKGQIVDHRNGDGLDCRRANLRVTSATINGLNTPTRRGYCFCKPMGRWKAYIYVSGKCRHLGYFATEEGAAEARRAALTEMGV